MATEPLTKTAFWQRLLGSEPRVVAIAPDDEVAVRGWLAEIDMHHSIHVAVNTSLPPGSLQVLTHL